MHVFLIMNAISDQIGFLNFVVPMFHTLLLLLVCKQNLFNCIVFYEFIPENSKSFMV